ncbi:hypothetical protein ACFL6C_13220 [Myxococcota bacterium]
MKRLGSLVLVLSGVAGCSMLLDIRGQKCLEREDCPDGLVCNPTTGECGPTNFCDTRPGATFCQSFDDASSLLGWDRVINESALSLDSIAQSPPSALHIVVPPSQECLYARFDKVHSPGAWTVARFELAFRLGSGFERAYIAQLIARGMAGFEYCTLFLRISNGGVSQVLEQNKPLDGRGFYNASTDIPVTFFGERWVRAAVEMTLGESPHYSFSVEEGTPVIEEAMHSDCAGVATEIETNPGVHYHCDEQTTELWIDDMVVELRP